MTVGLNSFDCLHSLNHEAKSAAMAAGGLAIGIPNNNEGAAAATTAAMTTAHVASSASTVTTSNLTMNTNGSLVSSMSSSSTVITTTSSAVSGAKSMIASCSANDQNEPCIALPTPSDNNNNSLVAISSISSTNTEVPTQPSSQQPLQQGPSSHSLGQLKRLMRASSAPRSGRNHAGAKYLASQYTKSKFYI